MGSPDQQARTHGGPGQRSGGGFEIHDADKGDTAKLTRTLEAFTSKPPCHDDSAELVAAKGYAPRMSSSLRTEVRGEAESLNPSRSGLNAWRGDHGVDAPCS